MTGIGSVGYRLTESDGKTIGSVIPLCESLNKREVFLKKSNSVTKMLIGMVYFLQKEIGR